MPKISELTTATSFSASDTIPIVQSGTTKQIAASLLAASISDVRNYGADADAVDNSTAFQAAIDAADTVYIPEGTWSFATTLTVDTGKSIIGEGPRSTILNYTGAAQAIKSTSPGTRTYWVQMRDLRLQDGGTGTIGIDFDSVSQFFLKNMIVTDFTTDIKIYSPTSGYAVYGRMENVTVQSATTGFLFTGTSSNAHTLYGCRSNLCTTGVKIEDSNDITLIGSQFESGTKGVHITATSAGASDANHIISCRFESNSGNDVELGTNVRYTKVLANYPAGGWTISDSGSGNNFYANGPETYDSRLFAGAAYADGSVRWERTYAAGSSEPFVVLNDSNIGSGTPITLKICTGRDAGSFMRGYGYTGSPLSPTDLRFAAYADGSLGIKDGITAPAAISGMALVYVDTADGDLKVRFGDGTIKTIVVDT